MANKITIDVEARAKGLQAILDQINQLKNSTGLNLTEGADKQLSVLTAKIKTLIDTYAGKNLLPGTKEFALFYKEFNAIIGGLNRFNDSLLEMKIPAEVTEQIKELRKEIDNLEKSARIAKNTSKLVKGKPDNYKLSASGQRAAIAQANKGGTITDTDGVIVTTIEQINKLRAKGVKLTAEQQTYLERLAKIEGDILQKGISARAQEEGKLASIEKQIAAKQEQIAQLQVGAIAPEGGTLGANDATVVAGQHKISKTIHETAVSMDNAKRKAQEMNDEIEQVPPSIKPARQAIADFNTEQEKNTSLLGKAAKQVITYGTVVNLLRSAYQKTIQTLTKMDEALTGMAVVTNMSRQETWQLVGSFQELATQTGKTSTEIANMATKFYQQGKSTTQVLQLVEAAAKAATIAGISGERSIDLLTNAMNGFQMSANEAMNVSDKFAALAAASATDYEELAVALSKVAAQANLAGMSMDFTLGMLSKGIEVTREAPETIGTALKTVIARMRELTDYGATLEDGMDVNRVAKALSNIGVELMDEEGQFRDLEAVITEVGMKWDTLNKNQQANVAVAMAGTRQQSRLIAMMQDFDRTLELVDISANSYGATLAQQAKYMEGLQAKTTLFSNAWENLLINLGQQDTIIGLVEFGTRLLEIADYLLNDLKLFWPLIVILGTQALATVNAKILEFNISKQQLTLDRQRSIAEKKRQLESITALKKERKENKQLTKEKQLSQKQEHLAELKINKVKNEQLIIEAQESLLKAKESEDVKQIAAAEQVLQNAKAEQVKINNEIQQTEIDINSLQMSDAEIAATRNGLLTEQIANLGILGGLLNPMLFAVQAINVAMTAGAAIVRVVTALRKKEGKEIDKNNNKVKKQTLSEKIKAAWTALSGMSQAGPAGVIAGIAIAAAIGVAIAVGEIATATKEEEKTSEKLKQLQADFYNLNNAIQTVTNLSNEFDILANKIVRTANEAERLAEIAQQIKDEGGDIDLNADLETQAAQIKVYQRMLQNEKDRNLKDQQAEFVKLKNEKLASVNSVKKAQQKLDDVLDDNRPSVDEVQVARAELAAAEAAALPQVLEDLLNSAEGESAFRNIARSQLDLSNFSSKAATALMDAIVTDAKSNVDDYFKGEEIDISSFVTRIVDTSTFSGMDEFGAALTDLLDDGVASEYIDFFSRLSKEGQAAMESISPIFTLLREDDKNNNKNFQNMITSLEQAGVSASKLNDILSQLASNPFFNVIKIFKDEKGTVLTDINAIAEMIRVEAIRAKQQADLALESWSKMTNISVDKQGNVTATGANGESVQFTAGSDAALYLEAKKGYEEAVDDASDKQATYNKVLDDKGEDHKKTKKALKEWQDAALEEENWKTKLDKYEFTDSEFNAYLNAAQDALDIKLPSATVDSLEKLTSLMDRIGKVTNLASMSIKDQQELLTDYPELYEAIKNGGDMTAETMEELYKTMYKSKKDDIQKNMTKRWTDLELELSKTTYFTDLDDASKEAAIQAVLGLNDDNNSWEQYVGLDLNSEAGQQFIKTYAGGSLQTAQSIQAIFQDLAKDVVSLNSMGKSWVDMLDQEAIKAANERVSGFGKITSAMEAEKNALAKINEDSELYLELLNKRNESLSDAIAVGDAEMDRIEQEVLDRLSFIKSDTVEFGIDIWFQDGKLMYDDAWFNKLLPEEKDLFLSQISTQWLDNKAAEWQNVFDNVNEWDEETADNMIARQEKLVEEQTEALEKRKEAYEEYFEQLDNEEAEQESEADRRSLVNQIQALTSATDGASKAKLKELRQQLEELNKEQLQQQKEEQRNALLDSIDTEIENLEIALEDLTRALKDIVAQNYLDRVDNPNSFTETGTDTASATTTTTTTDTTVEDDAVNNATQTTADNANTAYEGGTKVVTETVTNNTTQSVQIDELNIHTESLDTDQDFKLLADKIFNYVFERIKTENGLK